MKERLSDIFVQRTEPPWIAGRDLEEINVKTVYDELRHGDRIRDHQGFDGTVLGSRESGFRIVWDLDIQETGEPLHPGFTLLAHAVLMTDEQIAKRNSEASPT